MNETREEQLINAGKAAEADKKVDVRSEEHTSELQSRE